MATRLSRTRSVIVGVACLALGTAFGPTMAGAAGSFKDVVVRNTPSDPVPVAPQGTTQVAGTVTVGNLPATQKVEGTVNVANLPAQQPAPLWQGEPWVRDALTDRNHPCWTFDIPEGKVLYVVRALAGGTSDDDEHGLAYLRASYTGRFTDQVLYIPTPSTGKNEVGDQLWEGDQEFGLPVTALKGCGPTMGITVIGYLVPAA